MILLTNKARQSERIYTVEQVAYNRDIFSLNTQQGPIFEAKRVDAGMVNRLLGKKVAAVFFCPIWKCIILLNGTGTILV